MREKNGRLERTVGGFLAGLMIAGSTMLYPLEAMAKDYFGKYDSAKTQKVAQITWNDVKKSSGHYDKVKDMKDSDPQYKSELDEMNKVVKEAIKKIADGKYDVVIEKDDPKVSGATDISSDVKKKIDELEK